MSDSVKFSLKYAPGQASNSRAELSALWAVLRVAIHKQVTRLQLLGDSKMVVDWAKGRIQISAPHLQYVMAIIRDFITSFEFVSFEHIYRELNMEADLLSKMALALQPGIIEVEEMISGQILEHYMMF